MHAGRQSERMADEARMMGKIISHLTSLTTSQANVGGANQERGQDCRSGADSNYRPEPCIINHYSCLGIKNALCCYNIDVINSKTCAFVYLLQQTSVRPTSDHDLLMQSLRISRPLILTGGQKIKDFLPVVQS
jgi:hypothetical protein